MEAKSTKEITIKEETKKAITKELTLPGLMDLPVEVLAKIFNFLPNQDIRCGVSWACKRFYEICKDESLVPVRDLCIYGDKNRFYRLRDVEAVSGIIFRSQELTSLKIKTLNLDTVNKLVPIALMNCPNLISLEIVETSDMTREPYYELVDLLTTIENYGEDLCDINLFLNHFVKCPIVSPNSGYSRSWECPLYFIMNGCPKLKTLSLGSPTLDIYSNPNPSPWEHTNLYFAPQVLYQLSKGCKELKDLKISKAKFRLYNEEEVKEMFPNCNVDIKQSQFLLKACLGCGKKLLSCICNDDSSSDSSDSSDSSF